MLYNWQQNDWLDFSYIPATVDPHLVSFSQKTAYLNGLLKSLPKETEIEAMINTMILEAIKTSEIEGEYMSREEVVSSIKKNLGVHPTVTPIKDQRAIGVANLMVKVRETISNPLSQQMLFSWHQLLLGWEKQINAGKWRRGKEPMQIVSGSIGKEKVHFEAPPSEKVPFEMKQFIRWFNQTKSLHPCIRSSIAHLYFESIHPFEDGNGRIGRAIAEKALMQETGKPLFYSISATIEENKKEYYQHLKTAQRSNEITGWIIYFVTILIRSHEQAIKQIEFVIDKNKFLNAHLSLLNKRQNKAILRMLDQGTEGFEGGINARKYMSITKTSKATATRDLQDLLKKNVIRTLEGGGRSTSYELNL